MTSVCWLGGIQKRGIVTLFNARQENATEGVVHVMANTFCARVLFPIRITINSSGRVYRRDSGSGVYEWLMEKIREKVKFFKPRSLEEMMECVRQVEKKNMIMDARYVL